MKNTTHITLAISGAILFQIACSKPESPGSTPATSAAPPAPSADSSYPLTTCVVSGKPLGSMGEPVVIQHAGTTVKLCCKSCIPKFDADPDTYTAKLQ